MRIYAFAQFNTFTWLQYFRFINLWFTLLIWDLELQVKSCQDVVKSICVSYILQWLRIHMDREQSIWKEKPISERLTSIIS